MLLNKSTGSYVGRAGLSYRPGYEEAELGFVINSEFWRQGYAYEACQKILQLGREVYGINRVQALVIKENAASVALLKKLHFTFQETVILSGQEYERYLRIK